MNEVEPTELPIIMEIILYIIGIGAILFFIGVIVFFMYMFVEFFLGEEIRGMLKKTKADIEIKNKLMKENIIDYAKKNKGEMTKEITISYIDQTDDINLPLFSGMTHLHNAALIGNTDSIKILIDNHHYINSIDEQGRTPFDYAMIVGNIKNAIYLLDRGARLSFKNKKYWKSHMIPALHELGYDLRFNGFFPRISEFINKFNEINQALGSRS